MTHKATEALALSLICILIIIKSVEVEGSMVWTEFETRDPVFMDRASNITFLTTYGQYFVSKAEGAIKYEWLNGLMLSPSTKFIIQYLDGDDWESFELGQPTFLEVTDLFCQWRQPVVNGSQQKGYAVTETVFSEHSPPKLSIFYGVPENLDFDFRITFKVAMPQAWNYFVSGKDFVNMPKGSDLSLIRQQLRIVESPEKSCLQLLVDWSDYGETEVLLRGSTVTVIFADNDREVDPTVVGTTTAQNGLQMPMQEKLFFVHDLYWLFFCNGSHIVYQTSSDGTTWSSATDVVAGTEGYCFSAWTNSSHIQYVRSDGDTIYYRMGATFSNGSIIWVSTEKSVYVDSNYVFYPIITVDSDGFAWVSFSNGSVFSVAPMVIKNNWRNGSWQDSSGFPHQLKSTTGLNYVLQTVALSNSKVVCLYQKVGAQLWSKLWNGSHWESEETIDSTTKTRINAVVSQDDIHAVYLDDNSDLIYTVKANGSSWSDGLTLQTSLSSSDSLRISHDGTNLFVFWAQTHSNYKYFRFRAFVSGQWLSMFHWMQAPDVVTFNFVGVKDKPNCVAFILGSSSPYDVYFALFEHNATVSDFIIYSTNSDFPIQTPAWDAVEKKLTFYGQGQLTVDVGSVGQPFSIHDGESFLSWSTSGSNITFSATGSSLTVSWLSTSDVYSVSSERNQTAKDKVSDDFEPVVSPLGKFGMYILFASMGIVALSGVVVKATSGKKISRKPKGNSATRKGRLTGGSSYKGVKPSGARRKKR